MHDDLEEGYQRRHKANCRDNATSVRARLAWFLREYGSVLTLDERLQLAWAEETLRAVERRLADG